MDRLVKVARRGTDDPLYVHVEVQMGRERGFPKRMYDYRTPIRDRFGVPPESLAVLGDADPSWKPRKYVERQVESQMVFRFGMAKVVEWAGRLAELEAGGPFELFVAAHLETLATRKDRAARFEAKRRVLKNLLGRDLTSDEVTRWYYLIEWLMKLPAEMNAALWQELRQGREDVMKYVSAPERYYRDLAKTEGRAEGKAEGIAVGKREGLLASLRKILAARFGPGSESLVGEWEHVEIDRLEELLVVAVTAQTLDDVRRAIQAAP